VKIGRVVSPSMVDKVVYLDEPEEKHDSASFGEIQFWRETVGNNLVN
jgi:hypothetical protein